MSIGQAWSKDVPNRREIMHIQVYYLSCRFCRLAECKSYVLMKASTEISKKTIAGQAQGQSSYRNSPLGEFLVDLQEWSCGSGTSVGPPERKSHQRMPQQSFTGTSCRAATLPGILQSQGGIVATWGLGNPTPTLYCVQMPDMGL
jgi:hypothetical protein